jgi:hypothetical protein
VAGKDRTAYAATQQLGLVLMALSLGLLLGFSLLLFESSEIGVFGAITAIVVIAAGVVWQVDIWWARIVGLFGTMVGGLTAPFISLGVLQPLSPVEFILGLLYTLGLFVSLYGGGRAIVAGRNAELGPTGAEVKLRKIVIRFIVVASAASIIGFIITGG